MSTLLMRNALRAFYARTQDAHPGLLIQHGYPEYDDQTDAGRQRKAAHVARICATLPSALYHRAFARWRSITSDDNRFLSLELELESRLFIGLTAGGMLETGCTVSHTYGMPYIPGSAVKGAVRAHVAETPFAHDHSFLFDCLFGYAPTPDEPEGLAGAIIFHDAWWVPRGDERPFVQEVVTTHHLKYYGSEGAVPATDLDSPVPNAQIGVRGAFLFALEGPLGWLPAVAEMLRASLSDRGIGAKTRSGYGYFREGVAAVRCAWVDDTISSLMRQNNARESDMLRGRGLAEAWQEIAEPELKAKALADIKARWEANGWWEQPPPGRSSQQAKAIYDAGADPG